MAFLTRHAVTVTDTDIDHMRADINSSYNATGVIPGSRCIP